MEKTYLIVALALLVTISGFVYLTQPKGVGPIELTLLGESKEELIRVKKLTIPPGLVKEFVVTTREGVLERFMIKDDVVVGFDLLYLNVDNIDEKYIETCADYQKVLGDPDISKTEWAIWEKAFGEYDVKIQKWHRTVTIDCGPSTEKKFAHFY